MKKIAGIALFFMCHLLCAQTNGNSTVSLRPFLPAPDSLLSQNSINVLDAKLSTLLTNANLTISNAAAFIIVPKVNINDQQTVDGMQKLTTVKLDLVLYVKNRIYQNTFATYTQALAGSGKSSADAIQNALSHFNPKHISPIQFVNETIRKIENHYSEQCTQLIALTKKKIQIQDFESALTVLYAIPEGNTCQQKVNILLAETYQNYQQKNCQTNLLKAQNAFLVKDYQTAVSYLNLIDSQIGMCEQKYNQLIAKLEKETSEVQRKTWELRMKQQNGETLSTKYQLDILKSIVTNYYKNQNTHYIFITP
ncbi:hypothetical protein QNI19_27385 [Cytophagaceae bacterium DM2B3-1]|uniref:Uncharacterized protein n=1 Tax=Xanthocytophaga flava TaxID=3048013 RepID=A0ABT7CUU3_9BACT|nr:hypothetical protein [Xanthocytophaga flavus]MDJ1471466.1 hypothetical protein [Xanthocytophaga flavus]MDJ1496687.1 hypothetical protein [Xanthocytophaga flavus]